ncbi:MAG: ABC transporter ATP-binding protein [Candidatus Palauibacterales bacterium]|jgi:lipoprotein-releasing system ATP-binding protein|nr:ABC transporter ATP-binding protein [Candidatus Palauibacterales bacterium]
MNDRMTANPATAVEASAVQRNFDGADGRLIRVLRGVDLRLERGQTVAIVGPSGSGKSTLLHILGGLDLPTAGRIFLGGRDLADLTDLELAAVRNRYVGFVFQFHHLLRDFTALENVMMPQLIAGASRDEARRRALELLDQVGLADRSGHVPAKLSGGEQQRVAAARALVNEPPLLLADEPSGNLDLDTSELLHDVLFDLVRDHGTAMVVVTHNSALAARTDRILRLSAGVLELTRAEEPEPYEENGSTDAV